MGAWPANKFESYKKPVPSNVFIGIDFGMTGTDISFPPDHEPSPAKPEGGPPVPVVARCKGSRNGKHKMRWTKDRRGKRGDLKCSLCGCGVHREPHRGP